MERLTEWDEYGNADIIALSDVMPEIYAELSFSETNDLTDALNCLAAYEDAMALDRVQKLARAEKDGRLVVLPCKVGDMVWTNFSMSGWYFRGKDKPYSARVVFVGLNDSDEMGKGLINVAYGKQNYMMQFPLSDIGKTVFLTREEAEAALKKREEAHEREGV